MSGTEISLDLFVPDGGGRIQLLDNEPICESRTFPLVEAMPPAISEPEPVGAVFRREVLGIWPNARDAAGSGSAGSASTRCPRCYRHGVPEMGEHWETCPTCFYVYREPRCTAELRRDDFDGGCWVRVRARLGRQKAVREARVTEADLNVAESTDALLTERARQLLERLLETWRRNLPPVPEDVLDAERSGFESAARAVRESDRVDALRYAVRMLGIPVDVDPRLPPGTVRIVQRADERTRARVTVAPGTSPLTPEAQDLVRAEYEAIGARVRDSMQSVVDSLTPRLNQMAEQISAFADAVGPILHPEPDSPADVMQRAIEARRNRSTGPVERRRAPQRIDPTRGTR